MEGRHALFLRKFQWKSWEIPEKCITEFGDALPLRKWDANISASEFCRFNKSKIDRFCSAHKKIQNESA